MKNVLRLPRLRPLSLNGLRMLLAMAIFVAAAALPLDTSPRVFLLGAAFFVALDVALNSPWLAGIQFQWLADRRHYLYTSTAAACIGSLLPVSKNAPWALLLVLFTLATSACALAVADVLRQNSDANL